MAQSLSLSSCWISARIGLVQFPVASSWDVNSSCRRPRANFSTESFFLSTSSSWVGVMECNTTWFRSVPLGSPNTASESKNVKRNSWVYLNILHPLSVSMGWSPIIILSFSSLYYDSSIFIMTHLITRVYLFLLQWQSSKLLLDYTHVRCETLDSHIQRGEHGVCLWVRT